MLTSQAERWKQQRTQSITPNAIPDPEKTGGLHDARQARWLVLTRLCAGILFLGVLGAPAAAQTPAAGPGRLTVRPRELASSLHPTRAGEYRLDSLPDTRVYVPEQCVGANPTWRCPLVVSFGGAGEHARDLLALHRPLADAYGTILLVPPSTQGNGHRALPPVTTTSSTHMLPGGPVFDPTDMRPLDVHQLDAALSQVLRRFAVDPARIALVGFASGGAYAFYLGYQNQDLFSRIVALSPGATPLVAGGPTDSAAQFFLSSGAQEGQLSVQLPVARQLRQEGHRVTQVLGLRGHRRSSREADVVWNWLQKSWAQPEAQGYRFYGVNGEVATDGARSPNLVPLLTPDVVARLTTFWQRMTQLPDSLRPAAFRRDPDLRQPETFGQLAYHGPLAVSVGDQEVWVLNMPNIPWLVQWPEFSAVGAALWESRLIEPLPVEGKEYLWTVVRQMLSITHLDDEASTWSRAAREQLYREALLSALATAQAGAAAGPLVPDSPLAQNVAFVRAHAKEVAALERLLGVVWRR